MTYRFLDVEASATLSALVLRPDESGIGVLVRHRGVPVGVVLQECRGGAVDAARLRHLVDGAGGLGVTRAAIRDELTPSPAASLDVTLAVCTKDRPERLARCLDALAGVDAGGHRVAVVVVDNAPSDTRTRDLVAGRPGVRYVLEPAPGLDVARNRALAECDTELLAFVDDDVVLDPGWLDGLASALGENPEAAAVTGFVGPLDLDTEARVLFERRGGFRRGFEMRRFASGNAYRRNHPFGTGGFGTGANMVFRTEALRMLGGFDPALDTGRSLPGGGDLDVFFRVIAAGHVLVYTPAMSVRHEHRSTMPELRRQYWTWGTGYMAFLYAALAHRRARSSDVIRAAAWWARRESVSTWSAARRRDPARIDVAGAPLAGGLLTFLWKYPLSRWRQRR